MRACVHHFNPTLSCVPGSNSQLDTIQDHQAPSAYPIVATRRSVIHTTSIIHTIPHHTFDCDTTATPKLYIPRLDDVSQSFLIRQLPCPPPFSTEHCVEGEVGLLDLVEVGPKPNVPRRATKKKDTKRPRDGKGDKVVVTPPH